MIAEEEKAEEEEEEEELGGEREGEKATARNVLANK